MGCACINESMTALQCCKLSGGSMVFRHSGQLVLPCCMQFIMQCTCMVCPHGSALAGLVEWNKFSRHTGQSVWNRSALHL
jgi:hypothetical protein